MQKKSTVNIAVVILNWNGTNDTIMCIKSILKQTYTNFDVIVVDNHSSHEQLLPLQKFCSNNNIELLENSKNKGFAGGVNTGIRHALDNGYAFVALVNNDAVLDDRWLNETIKISSSNPDISIITGLLLNKRGSKIDTTAEEYSLWGIPFPRSRNVKNTKAPKSGYVFGASGGASLYKTDLFKEIGLFDESFFAYYEDVDISFRAQLAGHKIYYTNKAIAYHKQGATSSKLPGFTVYQTFKNLPLLYIKNVPSGLLIAVGTRLALLYWLMFGKAILKGAGWPALKGWLASIWYFWTKALWDRFGIQSRKKVTLPYINRIIWHDLPPDQTGMRKFRAFFTGK